MCLCVVMKPFLNNSGVQKGSWKGLEKELGSRRPGQCEPGLQQQKMSCAIAPTSCTPLQQTF